MLMTYQNSKETLLKCISVVSKYDKEKVNLIIECLYYLEKSKTKLLLKKLTELSSFFLNYDDIQNTKKILQIELFIKINTEKNNFNLVTKKYENNIICFNKEINNNNKNINIITQIINKKKKIKFRYKTNNVFTLNSLNHYDKADLAALILLTLLYYKNEAISRRDIERLSQKFIYYFPSLKDNKHWENKYGTKSPFNCFSTRFVKNLVEQEMAIYLPEKVKSSTINPRKYKLTALGLQVAEHIAIKLNFEKLKVS